MSRLDLLVRGGIVVTPSGCQTGRATVLAESDRLGLTLPEVAALTAAAERFSLSGKGSLEPGCDADLALVAVSVETPLAAADLLSRHPHSLFTGRSQRGSVRQTILCGRTVFETGRVANEAPVCHLVRSVRAAGQGGRLPPVAERESMALEAGTGRTAWRFAPDEEELR